MSDPPRVVAAGPVVAAPAEVAAPEQPRAEDRVNSDSRPSDLRITDMRTISLTGLPMNCTIIRIDTNQGISGYGEVRDGASKSYALVLKSRLVGENPCDIDRLFRKVRQFGFHARQGGGVSAVEMALVDLAGKAYGVPAYQLAGGRFRDKVLCYADTPSRLDPDVMAALIQHRVDQGYRFLKMDIGIDLVAGIKGAVNAPPDALGRADVMHPFTGIQLTTIGIDALVEYVGRIREAVGYTLPLAADHFGHLGLESCIRLGRALDQFTLAWYEDMIPWQFTDQYVRLSESVTTPICTGEDIYLRDGFRDLVERRARRRRPPRHHDLAAGSSRRSGSATTPASTGSRWRSTWPARPWPRLPASTRLLRPSTSWRWRTTRPTSRNGAASSAASRRRSSQDGSIAVPETPGLGLHRSRSRTPANRSSTRVIPTGSRRRRAGIPSAHHDRLWS